MIALLWPVAAYATNYTGDVCVDVGVEYDDLGGDRWLDNDVAKAGRGLRVKVTDTNGNNAAWYWLSESDGCLHFTTTHSTFRFAVYSKTQVNGVEVNSWAGDATGSRSALGIVFLNLSANNAGGNTFSYTLTVPGDDQRWRNVMVATMVFRDSDWDTNDAPTEDCCTTGAGPDGTCGTPANHYQPITGTVDMQAGTTAIPLSCCQSRLRTLSGGTVVDYSPKSPGASTSANTFGKFTIAHELGHVIAFKRAGDQEVVDQNAPVQGCVGDYDTENSAWFGNTNYGNLTKEYVSLAMKEGWANFVAMATWNAANGNRTEFQGNNENDWDLDGTLDLSNAWLAAHATETRTTDAVPVHMTYLKGIMDCGGDPDAEGTSYTWPGPNTNFTIDGRNWLADLEAGNDASGCHADSNPDKEANRTTLYDVTAMYWDLYATWGLSRSKLSTWHVNTCFRTWSSGDVSPPDEDDLELPLNRWTLAGVNLGEIFAVDGEVDHVWH